jgi:hypothetical protein
MAQKVVGLVEDLAKWHLEKLQMRMDSFARRGCRRSKGDCVVDRESRPSRSPRAKVSDIS